MLLLPWPLPLLHGRRRFHGGWPLPWRRLQARPPPRPARPGGQFGRVGVGIGVGGCLGGDRVLPSERFVDLDEHLLLPLGKAPGRPAAAGPDPRVGRPVLEDPGLHVERFRGRCAALLAICCRGCPRSACAARARSGSGRGWTRRPTGRQLAHRDLRLLPLLPDVFADRVDCHVGRMLSVLPLSACNCKPSASTPGPHPATRPPSHLRPAQSPTFLPYPRSRIQWL